MITRFFHQNKLTGIILASLLIYSCNGMEQPTTTNNSNKTSPPKAVKIANTTTQDSTASTPNPEKTIATNNKDQTTSEPSKETTTPDNNTSAKNSTTNRQTSENKITTALELIARNLEKKNLVYDSNLKQDCSGIYHQIKDSIQVRIPELADQSKFKYPLIRDIRSSRQIANWYHENNNLLIVNDAMNQRNKIRPGSVMFYGKPDKKYSNIDIDLLTDRNNGFSSKGAIMHIAVVTSIETDEQGNVIAYTIMHGRNKRYPASRSSSKEVQSNNRKGLPPFGNWSQQWVAMANIETTI